MVDLEDGGDLLSAFVFLLATTMGPGAISLLFFAATRAYAPKGF